MASDSTEISLNTVQEINQPQEEDSNSPHSSLAELFYDSTRIANIPAPIQAVQPAPIQPVEPVIGLTAEEQYGAEEDPNLTLDELLGLSSYEDHIRYTSLDSRWVVFQSAQLICSLGTRGQEISQENQGGRRGIAVVRNPS